MKACDNRFQLQSDPVMATQAGLEAVDKLPAVDEDRALQDRLRAAGVQLATRSLDRPRTPVKLRPRWLAFLLTLVNRPT
ncbi:MAG TPA: hypothetical protein VF771_19055 [Longimicrobiaceae bacterium]